MWCVLAGACVAGCAEPARLRAPRLHLHLVTTPTRHRPQHQPLHPPTPPSDFAPFFADFANANKVYRPGPRATVAQHHAVALIGVRGPVPPCLSVSASAGRNGSAGRKGCRRRCASAQDAGVRTLRRRGSEMAFESPCPARTRSTTTRSAGGSPATAGAATGATKATSRQAVPATGCLHVFVPAVCALTHFPSSTALSIA